jgi:integrase
VGTKKPNKVIFHSDGTAVSTVPSVLLVSSAVSDTVSPATPLQQKRKRQMSTRFQTGYVRAVGKKWYGRYRRDVAGQEKRNQIAVVLGSKSQMTKQQAKKKLLDIIEKEGLNNPNFLDALTAPAVPALTFNAVADSWVLKRLSQLKESTQYTAPILINKYLRPFFGTMTPEAIKTGVINDWIAGVKKQGRHPKTVHNLWKQFRAIMNWHAQQNDEPKRAWKPSLPTIPDVEQRWFTQEEMQLIIAAAKGQYKVLFHLAGFSGLRFGELAGLHYGDIDFVRGVIRVRRSVWRGIEVSTKTKKGYRDVFVDSGTIQMLKEHFGGRTIGRVFQTRNATPLGNHNVVRQVLKPICKRLGIEPGGMHAWRHGRVSHLQASNVPSDFTKTQVGHSSLRTTSIYTHFTEAFIRDTVERLSTGSGCAQPV